jgi:hypothetical protein
VVSVSLYPMGLVCWRSLNLALHATWNLVIAQMYLSNKSLADAPSALVLAQ